MNSRDESYFNVIIIIIIILNNKCWQNAPKYEIHV